LEWKLVTSVLSTIDDIEAWNRKRFWDWVASKISVVLPERNSLDTSSSLGGSKGDYGVATKRLVPCRK
jgi:hypothetical protein